MSQESEKIESLSQQLHAAQVRILKLQASNTALARMAANLTERLAMHEAGQMCYADALQNAYGDDGMRVLSSCDRQRATRLADALWSAGEQLMAAQLRGAR